MLELLLVLPIALVFVGFVCIGMQFYKLIRGVRMPISEKSYRCLDGDANKIREISQKYSCRIRGSVRLSSGRFKSIEEVKQKEESIIFP